jgi:hypothetical protein
MAASQAPEVWAESRPSWRATRTWLSKSIASRLKVIGVWVMEKSFEGRRRRQEKEHSQRFVSCARQTERL